MSAIIAYLSIPDTVSRQFAFLSLLAIPDHVFASVPIGCRRAACGLAIPIGTLFTSGYLP